MANPRWRSQTSGYETAVWAAKIAFYFLGILSVVAFARVAVPAAAGALASALPGSWASLRSWLSPLYLFIAVHFIILIIWKLSDQKQQQHHHHNSEQWAAEVRMMEPRNPTKFKSFEPSPAAGLLRNPSPEIWQDEISKPPTMAAVLALHPGESSPSDSSCLTTESGDKSTASSAFVVKTCLELEFTSSTRVAEEEDEAAAAGMESDPMEATWKPIMEKSSLAAAPPAPPMGRDARQAEAVTSSASHDELNRRFDDFIKKNHEQIRLPSSRRRQL